LIAQNNITTFVYNTTNDNLNSITFPIVPTDTAPAAPVVGFTYNSYGQVDTIMAPDGIVTKYEYYTTPSDVNNYGHIWKIIQDYGTSNVTTEYVYDKVGRVIQVKDPLTHTTKLAYNNLDKLVKITTPLDNITNLSYNGNKMLSQIESTKNDGNQITKLYYNIMDKLENEVNPLNKTTHFDYMGQDLVKTTDAKGNQTSYSYGVRDFLAAVTDANHNTTRYYYSDNGLPTVVIDANQHITSYEYDDFDRLHTIAYEDNSKEIFGYDDASNITSYTNRASQVITYTYDALNRIRTKTRPGESTITFTRDIAGRLKNVSSGSTYYYDRIGRLEDVVDAVSGNVGYEYDNASRMTNLVYPDETEITYQYYNDNRLWKVISGADTLAEYTYDQLGRRTLLTYGNGTSITYHYDLGNRLTQITNSVGGDFQYAYDDVGNKISKTIGNSQDTYAYDEVYRLKQVNYNSGIIAKYFYTPVYSYKKIDNGSHGMSVFGSNSLNQYISAIGIAYFGINFTYDLNGNLTFDGTYTYVYDCENRMTQVKQGQTVIADYVYDYLGRRIQKTVYYPATVVTKYCYDGDQVIAEYENGTLVRKFVYGPGINEPIMMIVVNAGVETKYYYHYDGLGSVIALSNSSGTVVESYQYSVHGQSNGANGVGNPYRFAGARYEEETSGNYYMRARYYSPWLGRFLSPDPIGYHDSMNLYQYCLNNPVNFTDPWGLSIQVQWHNVTKYGYHSSIRITPIDQERYKNDPRFKTDGNGNKYLTIGAGLGGAMKLVSNRNRPTDMAEQDGAMDIGASDKDCENKQIDKLLELDNNYQDNLYYEASPQAVNNSYNCNSYTHGLLNAAGIVAPDVVGNIVESEGGGFPGWERPVPAQYFH